MGYGGRPGSILIAIECGRDDDDDSAGVVIVCVHCLGEVYMIRKEGDKKVKYCKVFFFFFFELRFILPAIATGQATTGT
jgi:hypothetical protein